MATSDGGTERTQRKKDGEEKGGGGKSPILHFYGAKNCLKRLLNVPDSKSKLRRRKRSLSYPLEENSETGEKGGEVKEPGGTS